MFERGKRTRMLMCASEVWPMIAELRTHRPSPTIVTLYLDERSWRLQRRHGQGRRPRSWRITGKRGDRLQLCVQPVVCIRRFLGVSSGPVRERAADRDPGWRDG